MCLLGIFWYPEWSYKMIVYKFAYIWRQWLLIFRAGPNDQAKKITLFINDLKTAHATDIPRIEGIRPSDIDSLIVWAIFCE